jgi:sialidase-1
MAGLLNSGRVLITYRFAQGGGGPFLGWQNTFCALTDVGSCLATSRDDAWANILPLDHDDAAFVSDTGYTDWVQFDDGEIYVVNYRVGSEAAPERAKEPPEHDKRQQRASVRGYAFHEDEFQPQELPAEVVNYDRAEEAVIRDWARRTGYEIEEQ